MVTVPPEQLLAMATSSAHDRLARPEILARRLFEVEGRAYCPIWADFTSRGVDTVSAVLVETDLFEHDLIWHSGKQRWKLKFATKVIQFRSDLPARGTDDGELDLALLRVDPSAYGRLLGRYEWLITAKAKWLRSTQMNDEDADSLALQAFESALDRVTFRPGARLRHVIYNVTHQRALNLIRDRQRGGVLHQARKDIEYQDIGRSYSVDEQNPLLGASNLAQEFARRCVEGASPEEARKSMKLKKGDYLNVMSEIAGLLGVKEVT